MLKKKIINCWLSYFKSFEHQLVIEKCKRKRKGICNYYHLKILLVFVLAKKMTFVTLALKKTIEFSP